MHRAGSYGRFGRLAVHLLSPPGPLRPLCSKTAGDAAPGAGHPLLAALEPGPQRYVGPEHIHVVSHCKVPKEKADELFALTCLHASKNVIGLKKLRSLAQMLRHSRCWKDQEKRGSRRIKEEAPQRKPKEMMMKEKKAPRKG